jgi:hypothetical protein
LAQNGEAEKFQDPETGILFSQYTAEMTGKFAPKIGGFQLGVAFPAKLDKNEYLGHIVGIFPLQTRLWLK